VNPKRWLQVREILEQTLALPPDEQSSFLHAACAEDPTLRREVESLLNAHDRAGNFLNTPAIDLTFASRVGRRIGPYKIIEEIGRGGMGEVYRAIRADGQYEQQVAIKLVRAGQNNAFVVDRFRQERQILASLENPNIARLYDGGTTDDAIPYLVIELVEGTPIDQYCRDQRLNLRARLRLFLQLCDAIQYAHQRLVVHRDIKPSNILVTAGGVPKLLDFGIAKVLDSTGGVEATHALAMTPGFASPEQILSQPITTASDIYSLGVLLYTLLAGQSPYGDAALSSHELARHICEIDPKPPSSVTPQAGAPDTVRLPRDLDSVVLKALRKVPAERYASVERLADDVRRHLDGRAVMARERSTGYLLSKFITRHRSAVIAGALATIALFGGIAAIVAEARIAAANGERAARRFDDVHRLATSLIFEIHDSIQDLPGAIPARKLLAERALQYLDSLAKEAVGDLSLQRDLAAAYQRIADVQGNPFISNLGDAAGAMKSYEKSLALRRLLLAADPNNVDDGVGFAQGLRLHSETASVLGNVVVAMQETREAVNVDERIASRHPSDRAVLVELFRAYQDLGGILGGNMSAAKLNDLRPALDAHEKEIQVAQRLVALDPGSVEYKAFEAAAEVHMGDQLLQQGMVQEATVNFRQAAAAAGRWSAAGPSVKASYLQSAVATRLQYAQFWARDAVAATATTRHALADLAKVGGAESQDVRIRLYFAEHHANLADGLSQSNQFDEAEREWSQANEIIGVLVRTDPSNTEFRSNQAAIHYLGAEVARRRGDLHRALQQLQSSVEILESLAADAANTDAGLSLAATFVKVGDIQVQLGHADAAVARFRDALSRVGAEATPQSLNEDARYVLAGAFAGLGVVELVEAKRGGITPDARRLHRRQSCDWYRRSAATWAQIREPGALSPNGFYASITSAGIADSARCAPDQTPL
jgi:non-specific serine/threonine protein kinase/serine/threonine-protein kinase